MRYTVLLSTKRGANRVNPGNARSGSDAINPMPRRLRVFCSIAAIAWLPPVTVDHRMGLVFAKLRRTHRPSQMGLPPARWNGVVMEVDDLRSFVTTHSY